MATFGRAAVLGARAGQRYSTAAAAGAAGSVESLDQRSVFVRVRPAPVTLAERRSVLHVLEQHGKTEMFKKMANNASFIAITPTAAAATALIENSPMQYEFMAEKFQMARPWADPPVATRVHTVHRAQGTDSFEEFAAGETEMTETTTPEASGEHIGHKTFVVSVFPSHGYHHRSMIRNSPMHGPWPREYASENQRHGATYKNTFVYNALRAVIPESPASEALCDWRPEWDSNGSLAGQAAAASAVVAVRTGDSSQEGRPLSNKALSHIRQRQERRQQRELGLGGEGVRSD